MNRRDAELVETEEPEDDGGLRRSAVSQNNSIIDEDGEEGEFIGTTSGLSTSTRDGTVSTDGSARTTMLEALPGDEDVETNTSSVSNNNNTDSNNSGTVQETTTSQTTATSRPRTLRGYTLRDLEEEREVVQRRTGACVLLSSFLLLRLW